MNEPAAVLLDTCAVLWLANRSPMADDAVEAIIVAGLAGGIHVSVISAWEIGLLARPGTSRSLRFIPDAKTWFARLMALPGIRPAPLTPEMAIDSASLPGTLHSDPADRLLIATARHMGLPLVTRDARILAYAGAGFVRAIPC